MKEKLAITVDVVKQGFGTTNDGNTARRFFEHPRIVSNITGVKYELIQRLAVILQVKLCCLISERNSIVTRKQESLKDSF